jgi:Domain of unknown function (DUF4282)
MDFGDLFSFDKKLAPQLIKPIYWLGCVLIVLSAFYIFVWWGFGSMLSNFFWGLWMMVYAVFFAVAGILGLRIGAEVTLAIFELHDKLVAGPATTSTSTPS